MATRLAIAKKLAAQCKAGKHQFEMIMDCGSDPQSHVVRWCKHCGAVSVDLDSNGQTHSGMIASLKMPRLMEIFFKLKSDTEPT